MYICWSVVFTEGWGCTWGCGGTGAPLALLPGMSKCSTLAAALISTARVLGSGVGRQRKARQLLLGFYLDTLKYSQVGVWGCGVAWVCRCANHLTLGVDVFWGELPGRSAGGVP